MILRRPLAGGSTPPPSSKNVFLVPYSALRAADEYVRQEALLLSSVSLRKLGHALKLSGTTGMEHQSPLDKAPADNCRASYLFGIRPEIFRRPF